MTLFIIKGRGGFENVIHEQPFCYLTDMIDDYTVAKVSNKFSNKLKSLFIRDGILKPS